MRARIDNADAARSTRSASPEIARGFLLTALILASGFVAVPAVVLAEDGPTALNPIYPPLFAIDPNTTLVPLGFSPGDVLFPREGVYPPDPNVPVGPDFPIRVFRTINLGLLRVDDIDGLSLPNTQFGPSTPFALIFSVDRFAVGLVPPDPALVSQGFLYNVQDQASKNQAAGDSYMGLRLYTREGPFGPGLRGPGNNTLIINQGDAGGVDYRVPPSSSPDPNAPSTGNVNAGAGSGAPSALNLRNGASSISKTGKRTQRPVKPLRAEDVAESPAPVTRRDREPISAMPPLPVHALHRIHYDVRTGEISPDPGVTPRGPDLCWDATNTTGFFSSSPPYRINLNWGDLSDGCVRPNQIVFGYATDASQPITADLGFYFNENGYNSTERGLAALQRVPGLPGGTGGPGFYSGWIVTVTLPEPIDFSAGGDLDGDSLRDFGYAYGFRKPLDPPTLVGALTAWPDPNIVPSPAPGIENAFDRFTVEPNVPHPPDPNSPLIAGWNTNYAGTFWFGGFPPAGFLIGLGRGVNPPTPLFFSLSRSSPSTLLQRIPGSTGSGADVYIDFDPNTPGNEFTWANHAMLGLLPGDDIDGLTVIENGNLIYDNNDIVLFSLRRGSPSLPGAFAPGDVLVRRGFAPIEIFAQAESLGLIADRLAGVGDDMDMFDIAPCPDIMQCVLDWGIRVFPCPGDLNGDAMVDLADLAISLGAFGTCVGDPSFVPAADVNNDGCVNLMDLAIVLANYGNVC